MKISSAALLFIIFPMTVLAAEWINDPSMIPVTKGQEETVERYRLLADFNADGIEDMAISHDIELFGNAGGGFDLYMRNIEGKYRKHSEFFAHPMAISLEKHGDEIRMWRYIRGGGSVGRIGYQVIEDDGLSKYTSIVIHPGDGGTKMGNAIIKAVGSNSDVRIKVEKSETKKGIVKWSTPNQ